MNKNNSLLNLKNLQIFVVIFFSLLILGCSKPKYDTTSEETKVNSLNVLMAKLTPTESEAIKKTLDSIYKNFASIEMIEMAVWEGNKTKVGKNPHNKTPREVNLLADKKINGFTQDELTKYAANLIKQKEIAINKYKAQAAANLSQLISSYSSEELKINIELRNKTGMEIANTLADGLIFKDQGKDVVILAPDLTKASEFYLDLASNDIAEAQFKLATLYNEGKLGEKDIEKAYVWYKRSAVHNYGNSAEMVSKLEPEVDEIQGIVRFNIIPSIAYGGLSFFLDIVENVWSYLDRHKDRNKVSIVITTEQFKDSEGNILPKEEMINYDLSADQITAARKYKNKESYTKSEDAHSLRIIPLKAFKDKMEEIKNTASVENLESTGVTE